MLNRAGTAPGLYFKSTPAGTYGGQGTYAMSINPAGAIAGSYIDENNVGHGSVRAPDSITYCTNATQTNKVLTWVPSGGTSTQRG